jgi:hypothetical protein
MGAIALKKANVVAVRKVAERFAKKLQGSSPRRTTGRTQVLSQVFILICFRLV